MAWYIRKAISFGPLRFNISKSGIGASFGVTGARIGSGPSGTYVHLGRHGIYYKKYLSQKNKKVNIKKIRSSGKIDKQVENLSNNLNNFILEKHGDLVNELNSKVAKRTLIQGITWVLWLIASTYVLINILALPSLPSALWVSNITSIPLEQFIYDSSILFLIVLILYLILLLPFYFIDRKRLTIKIIYNFDKETESNLESITLFFKMLSENSKNWVVDFEDEETNRSAKEYNAMSDLCSPVYINQLRIFSENPPCIDTNLKLYSFSVSLDKLNITCYFLPDLILIYEPTLKSFSSINYTDIKVNSYVKKVIEDDFDSVPEDTEIISSTWKYVKKDGKPDMRYKDNYEVPIVQYGFVEIKFTDELNIVILHSNSQKNKQLSKFLKGIINFYSKGGKFINNQSELSHSYKEEILTNLKILGISDNAINETTIDKVKNSYLKKMKEYHPDKYYKLPKDFQELANKKTQEISNAFLRLSTLIAKNS